MTSALGATYARFWSAAALSALGDGVRKVAIPLLAASLTHNPALVAAATAAGQLPWLLFGLVAGAVTDRTDRRRVMAVVDAARLLLLAALVVTVTTGTATLPLLYLVAFACGIGETLRDTAATAMVPPLVHVDSLDRANGYLVNSEVTGNELLGPPLGGYLFGVAVALPFAVNGGTLAVAVALVLSLPAVFAPRRSPAAGAGITHDIGEAVGWLARQRTLRAVALMGAVVALTDGAWYSTLVLYTRRILHLPPYGFGLLITIDALGGLAGGLGAARLTRRVRRTSVLKDTLLAAAATQAAMGLTSDPEVAAVALTESSFAFAAWNVVSLTLRQSLTPAGLQGRVAGAYRTLISGAEPVGALLGGTVATYLGLRAPLLLGVPVILLTYVLGSRALRGEPGAADGAVTPAG